MTTNHPQFDYIRSEKIDSLNIEIEEYRHLNTGAMHYHLSSDNPENVFLVAFRTVPTDSTGVAHILEHTVLCGSEKYPVRDPFFMMIRRSLNTFMNAFTSSDWTAYPFASKNKKDFNNLLEVYLDAVFFSRLHELDFSQEGHRIEFEQPDNPESELVYKGVVYNEMKGAMSSPISQLWQNLTKYLYPNNTYHYNSGGDPLDIPSLSYSQLKDFYKKHYHPSNSIIMTYGDIPAIEHQQRIHENALSRFERSDASIEVENEKRYPEPIHVQESYTIDAQENTENKSHIVLGWLLGESTNLKEMLRAHLLSGVLLDNGSCPLRYALETSELGSAPSPLCGIEDSNKEMIFMCGLEGSSSDRSANVEDLILNVLSDVEKNGIALDKIESVLHQLELHQREVSGDSYPYGLQLILDALPPAIHRGDPVAVLNLDPVLEELREEIKDPDFIKSLVRENLLENKHRVLLTLNPDIELSKANDELERQRLLQLKQKLTETDKISIVNLASELESRQNQQDDPDVLPKVGIEDIPSGMLIPEGTSDNINDIPTTFYDQGTNGLIYQQAIIPIPELDDELLQLLPYYTTCVSELGCGDQSYLDMQSLQASISGGISAYTSIRSHISDIQDAAGHFVISGKALHRNTKQFTDLLINTLENVKFDELDRIQEIISQKRAQKEQGITGSGHVLAMMAASSGMSPVAAMSHKLNGLAGIQFIKQLDDSLENKENLRTLAAKFKIIHERILDNPKQLLVIGEGGHLNDYKEILNNRLNVDTALSASNVTNLQLPSISEKLQQVWVTSTQVNFCSKAYPVVPVEHPDAPALTVLGTFMKNGFLHRVVREQGGAYGGGASYDSNSGSFRFYSYRDPRNIDTLTDFDNAIDWVTTNNHEPRQLEEAILGVIGSIDKPGSPAGEAKQAFHNNLHGRSPEQRRNFRSRILDVTLSDLVDVSKKYLRNDNASVAVLTNETVLPDFEHMNMEIQHV